MSNLDKVKITEWLKQHSRDREWLADQCGAEIGTVNSWFSTRGFSDAALATIDKLMQLDALRAKQSAPVEDETALIQFSAGEFERIERARLAVGSPERPVFYRDAIISYVDEVLVDERQAVKYEMAKKRGAVEVNSFTREKGQD
jgi:hypothetical protein